MGIYFGNILLLNWLTCLDETKPKNMFAESVKIWVLKQISSITANSDQSFIWCTKKRKLLTNSKLFSCVLQAVH